MKYIIYKTCDGNIDLSCGDIKIVLTDTYNCIEVDDDTYWTIMEKRQHLIANNMLVVKRIDEEAEKSKKQVNKATK